MPSESGEAHWLLDNGHSGVMRLIVEAQWDCSVWLRFSYHVQIGVQIIIWYPIICNMIQISFRWSKYNSNILSPNVQISKWIPSNTAKKNFREFILLSNAEHIPDFQFPKWVQYDFQDIVSRYNINNVVTWRQRVPPSHDRMSGSQCWHPFSGAALRWNQRL